MAPSSTSSSVPVGPQQTNMATEPEKQTQYASIVPPQQSAEDRLQLQRTVSSVSHHDMANVQYVATGDNDVVYNRFSERRKMIVVAVVSFCGFLAPISSTTVLSAVPEVAATYSTDGSIINVSNALYMLFMGLSPCFYGPYGNIYGRKWVSVMSAALFTAFSIGTALAPNLAAFFVFRILTAFQGTAFLVIGSAVIGDMYKPTERATALGWFLSGTLIGPALGPFIGGIIVTFRSWRDIFWLQTALAGTATLLCFFLQPETIHNKRADELEGLPAKERAHKMWQWLNPFRIIMLYRYPNILLTGLASSSLVWNMYSLLTPIRYVLNPRFGLETPLQSGLFYIAPGCGYLVGTFFGGRWADHVVKKYIPQLFCFPSLNTYCLDVMQSRSAEVVAGNYFMRYMFAAAGSAACLPAVRAIGVGWFSTISAVFLMAGAAATYVTALYGKSWRMAIDEKKAAKKVGESSV
ncbi:conserved hypothetical protein [Pyrenophora tritici-repentis Pt-1C-BFP]|uniref:Major facilitator superfamily (MFS) profile domain-containing protein n=1 Tax=Pyrenophora tritici-repentis (strain Pt-1C-BFP) TaxID=426418 RepID=B2W0P5_PYRTR|nr:uncharacterized protein PTRG_04030 [Pyrenophora tritici-repentis Pt-1C-BFP]EDU46868.1 conserved hypothetical protein [Pyrenophora tritici-repentis Pt-1C-BFP]